MKKILVVAALTCFSTSFSTSYAQKSSPYVQIGSGAESGLVIVNNTGFRATSLRSAALPPGPVTPHTQNDAVNAKVSPRFVVAKNDVSVLIVGSNISWALASGFDLTLNLALASLSLILPTGCNLYTEFGTGAGGVAGNWRVPTQRELILIYLSRQELNAAAGFAAFSLAPYWSSTEAAAAQAWSVDMATGSNYNQSKNSLYRVRCVRDI